MRNLLAHITIFDLGFLALVFFAAISISLWLARVAGRETH